MTFLAKVGDFTFDPSWTYLQYVDINTGGFQPKAVIFMYIRSTASGNELQAYDGNTYDFGIGVASERTIGRFTNISHGVDDYPDQDGFWKGQYNNRIAYINTSGYASPDAQIDFNTMTSSGVKLRVYDQAAFPYKISYLALGGTSLVEAFSATRLRIDVSGYFELAETGFKPDVLFEMSSDYSYQTSSSAVQDFAVGVADKDMNQGVAYHGYTDWGTPAPYHALGHGCSGEISAGIWKDDYPGDGSYAAYWMDTLTEFTDNGFVMYHNPVPSGGTTYTPSYYNYLAMRGGLWKVGFIETRVDGEDIIVDIGFRPVALMFLSSNKPQSSYGAFAPDGSTSFGIATSETERRTIAVWNEYVESGFPLNVASAKYSDAVYVNLKNGELTEAMDIKSIDNTGFTVVMDTFSIPYGGNFVTYLAWGYEVIPEITTTGNDQPTVFMV